MKSKHCLSSSLFQHGFGLKTLFESNLEKFDVTISVL